MARWHLAAATLLPGGHMTGVSGALAMDYLPVPPQVVAVAQTVEAGGGVDGSHALFMSRHVEQVSLRLQRLQVRRTPALSHLSLQKRCRSESRRGLQHSSQHVGAAGSQTRWKSAGSWGGMSLSTFQDASGLPGRYSA